MASIYDFTAKSLQGKDVPLSEFRDKVLLIVNTASKCGFTPQYAGLETLYEKLNGKGLTILGFPCNKFGKQEPGGAEEIGALSISEGRTTGRPGYQEHQVEFHQVSRRQGRQSRRPFRADDETGRHREIHSEGVVSLCANVGRARHRS